MRDDFSTLDICKALNIPRERLRSWMKEGFIEPNEPSEGQGKGAVFTRDDVYKIEFFKFLVESGTKRQVAAYYTNLIREDRGNFQFLMFTESEDTIKHKTGPSMTFFNDYKQLLAFFIKNLGVKMMHYDKPLIERHHKIEIYNYAALKRKVDIALSILE